MRRPRNGVVMAPMITNLASPGGCPTDECVAYMARRTPSAWINQRISHIKGTLVSGLVRLHALIDWAEARNPKYSSPFSVNSLKRHFLLVPALQLPLYLSTSPISSTKRRTPSPYPHVLNNRRSSRVYGSLPVLKLNCCIVLRSRIADTILFLCMRVQ